ncbi:hypothetical protein HK104_008213 [Borealophlyctis nickersoniae]|nr:hypothetical protein HK104_008213 [Borealophlyctis nickersoniae]
MPQNIKFEEQDEKKLCNMEQHSDVIIIDDDYEDVPDANQPPAQHNKQEERPDYEAGLPFIDANEPAEVNRPEGRPETKGRPFPAKQRISAKRLARCRRSTAVPPGPTRNWDDNLLWELVLRHGHKWVLVSEEYNKVYGLVDNVQLFSISSIISHLASIRG